MRDSIKRMMVDRARSMCQTSTMKPTNDIEKKRALGGIRSWGLRRVGIKTRAERKRREGRAPIISRTLRTNGAFNGLSKPR